MPSVRRQGGQAEDIPDLSVVVELVFRFGLGAGLLAFEMCRAKTGKGTGCQSPAVKGKRRCRMDGGTNPGAPKGSRNVWKHGAYSAEAELGALSLKIFEEG